MAEELLSQALETAWIVYRTARCEIPIDDFRRSSLARFLKMRLETGKMDIEDLALEGLAFLRRLDRARVADGEDYEDVRRGRRATPMLRLTCDCPDHC
jgi:hypothetical protein